MRNVFRPASSRGKRRGFTLIELLVVIGVIALLIGLLLPSLGRARKVAWKVVSMANMRSLVTAGAAYQSDFQGHLPVVYNYRAGRGQWGERNLRTGLPPGEQAPNYPLVPSSSGGGAPYCSWGYGGKNNGVGTASGTGFFWSGGWAVYDIEAADRPLNAYVTDAGIPAPPAPSTLGSTATERYNFELEVYKDPSDKRSFQQNWSSLITPPFTLPRIPVWTQDPTGSSVKGGRPMSSYDDVGTSYHVNLKWYDQIRDDDRTRNSITGYSPGIRGYLFGMQRLRAGDSFIPSRLSWLMDQNADAVVYNPQTTFRLTNSYGDSNRSVLGFMDGHASYLPVLTGGWDPAMDPNNNSFRNQYYTFIFDDLPPPRTE